MFDGARDFLADHRAHRSANELEIHHRHNHVPLLNFAFATDHGVLQAGLVLRFLDAFEVAAAAFELQRILRFKVVE